MRGALILLLLAVTTVAAAPRTTGKKPLRTTEETAKPAAKPAKPAAKPADAPKPRPPGPEDARAVAILERIVAGPDTAARKPAIAELTEIAPRTIDAIGEWLARPHASDVAARRAVLAEIKASVPDEKGTFSQPPRQTGKQQKADDELDWQAALLALDPRPEPSPEPSPAPSQDPSPAPSQDPSPAPSLAAVGEVIADDAAIRALAATGDRHAAQVIFDTAFGADTMIYRDECGRYLRKMEPASIPALIRESMAKRYDRKRYATWQLERLDRQEPGKALDAALGDEALMIAILDVFRTTHHREAVHAVWKRIDADAPRVRAAARAAWMAYITGPPPPPAPVAKLNLPGGKKTKKPKPLWLTYRELADTELRKAANELLHEDYPLDDPTLDDSDDEYEKKIVKIDLEAVTMRLFGYYDAERTEQETAQWSAAKGKAESGDLAAAIQMVDRMLAINPDRSERAEMAKLYLSWAKQLEDEQQWDAAAAAYSKVHGLDPRGASAGDALAAHHYTLGKSLEAQGKDGSPDYRRAIALKPDYAPAHSAAKEAAAAGRPIWMLYAATAAAAVALLLFAAAMIRRRA